MREHIPQVNIVATPNGITHKYNTEDIQREITATPHIELFGISFSNRFGYESMDTQTQALYDAVKALHRDISDVSIQPYELSVTGPTKVERDLIKGAWPDSLDLQIMQCLARHLGVGRLAFNLHHQTSGEAWDALNAIIAKVAVERGVTQPEGWPYVT